jgi:hydrogenase large subunit
MPEKISFSPVTRISGLLSIDLYLDADGRVKEANVAGEQFRGFEAMLKGRRITDAVYFTQRICGICSMAHGFTAARLVERIYGITPPPELVLLQQIMLGAEFLQNHIRHFYLLALPDYFDTASLTNSNIQNPIHDLRLNPMEQEQLTAHYFLAIEYSRKCHDALAVFGGKIPHQHGLTPEGVAVFPDADRRKQFLSLLQQIQEFLANVQLQDVYLLAKVYPEYFHTGSGPHRYISFGLFDPRFSGHFPAGILNQGELLPVNPEEIRQSIAYAWFETSDSETRPAPEKPLAYTWVKAPRYQGLSYEGGPLARKIIRSGNITPGGMAGGVMARLVARAEEAVLISKWMEDWVKQLPRDGQYIHPLSNPVTNQAVQMNDAPRGPLLHGMASVNEEIASYRIITPSTWNFSPKDENGIRGPAEESLIGASADPADPVEPGRIIRSFDPCLSCATHFIDWEGKNKFSLNITV